MTTSNSARSDISNSECLLPAFVDITLLPPATKLGQGYVFTHVCDSVHKVGEGVVSRHALQVSRPTPKGKVEGSGLGGSPGPHPGGSPG